MKFTQPKSEIVGNPMKSEDSHFSSSKMVFEDPKKKSIEGPKISIFRNRYLKPYVDIQRVQNRCANGGHLQDTKTCISPNPKRQNQKAKSKGKREIGGARDSRVFQTMNK